MSSLTTFNQVVPNVGVIGSSRRSPTQNPQKLVCINGNGSLESSNSSRSSTSGEEGFISGSSSAEEISHVDQLTSHFDILGIGKSTMNRFNGTNGGGYSSIIDEPAHKIFSSLNNSALFEQSNLREFKDRMKDDSSPLLAAYQQQLSITNQTSFLQQQSANLGFSGLNQTRQSQLPGAWFYENSVDEGLPGSGSASSGLPGECSPIAELNDDYQFASFRAALNNPYTVDEHVEVPSSEHVAEIVGRQGCKIKALRAKTNTYIKTPSRNEPPVFKITGRPEDVVEAKREIECAAEHFTQIRASRRHSQGGIPAPGHVTAYVRVPLRVVGLVVGPKGATIKRIQQDTHTYIITPSREREPIFEVTGLPENVASARREIEQHIYQRTGNMPITDPNTPINDYDLIAAAAAQAAAQAHSNLANRPNYGALATGTHLRRASVVLGASLLSGMQRNTDMINNGTYNEMMRSGMISKPYSASVSPPPPATNNNMFSANSCNSFYSPHDMASMSSSAAAAALLRSASNDYQTGNYQTWTSSGYANNGMQNGNSSAFVQDLFSSANTNAGLNMLSNGFDSLGGNNLCNLNSNKSASRDEGLGESPTVSCGKLNAEPYHLMSSIWSDLEANNIFEKPLDSSSAIQLATS